MDFDKLRAEPYVTNGILIVSINTDVLISAPAMPNLFDDYESLLHGTAGQGASASAATHGSQSATTGHAAGVNIPHNNNAGAGGLSSSRFGSFSSSHLGSESNYNDFNEALSSSVNSGILSPYSTGSSPDGFFLSATTSNAGSQASLDDFDLDLDANAGHPFGQGNDVLYPQNLAPVPMGESMSNSTVTYGNDQPAATFEPMVPVKEEEESPESRRSNYSDNKNTGNSSGSGSNSQMVGGKRIKSSHNLIEKKYRTNINSKIIELRNCVPSLRILVAKTGNHRTRSTNNEPEVMDDYYEGNGYTDDEEKCDGLKPAKKLNKATILAKASEYIKHLEKNNDHLRMENEHLKALLEQRSPQGVQRPQQAYASQSMHSSPYNNSSSTGGNLVSPLNGEPLLYDHQMLNSKLMMGNMEFTGPGFQGDRKYM